MILPAPLKDVLFTFKYNTMVFPQYDYKEYNRDNRDKWPENSWAKMLNMAYLYCRNLPKEKWLEFIGKCEASKLPSFHPYWRITKLEMMERDLETLERDYKLCVDNPALIPRLFNLTTCLPDIEQKIRLKKEEIRVYEATGL